MGIQQPEQGDAASANPLQPEITEQIGGFTYHDFGTALGALSEIDSAPEDDPFAERVILVAPALGEKSLKVLVDRLNDPEAPGQDDRVNVNTIPLEGDDGSTATLFSMFSSYWNLGESEGYSASVLEADLQDRADRIRQHLLALAGRQSNLLTRAAVYYQLGPR